MRPLLLAVTIALALAGPARAAAPDPERALDSPVHTQAVSPYLGNDAKKMFDEIRKIGARITAVDVLVVKGKPRYVLGFVANRGRQDRPQWWWDPVVSEKSLLARLKSRNARLIDISVFEIGGKRRLSAVSVANTGEAQKTWWWHPRVKRSKILGLTGANGSRIVDLERGKGKLYDVIAIKNDGVDQRAWWLLFKVRHSYLPSEASKLGARIQDIEHVGTGYDFDVVFVQAERKKGWFVAVANSGVEGVRNTRVFGARTAIVEYYVSPIGRVVAHVGVTDVDAATEAARAKLLGDSTTFEVSGTMGMLVSGLGAVAPLVSLNADLPHETASAMKALHHAAVTRLYEQRSLPLDKAGDFAYRQYIGLPSCPLENLAGRPVVQRTLGQTAIDMLRSSDNGATAAVLARVGGKAALVEYARSLGMRSVRLGTPIGCFDREAPNLWTLNDAGRLYANIASGRVATREPYVTHLLGSFLDGSAQLRSEWRFTAEEVGRPELAELSEQVQWLAKGGSYGIGDDDRISTSGGILWLPVRVGDAIERRPYVIATFFDVASWTGRVPASYKNTTLTLSRAAILEALATF